MRCVYWLPKVKPQETSRDVCPLFRRGHEGGVRRWWRHDAYVYVFLLFTLVNFCQLGLRSLGHGGVGGLRGLTDFIKPYFKIAIYAHFPKFIYRNIPIFPTLVVHTISLNWKFAAKTLEAIPISNLTQKCEQGGKGAGEVGRGIFLIMRGKSIMFIISAVFNMTPYISILQLHHEARKMWDRWKWGEHVSYLLEPARHLSSYRDSNEMCIQPVACIIAVISNFHVQCLYCGKSV